MGTLTVKQLIARLKKMPQAAKVAVCAHDQSPEDGEFDTSVQWVSEAPPALKARGFGVYLS